MELFHFIIVHCFVFDDYIALKAEECCTITLRDVILSDIKWHFVCFVRTHFIRLQIPTCMFANTVFTTEIRLNIFLTVIKSPSRQRMLLLFSLYSQPIHLSSCDLSNRGCFIFVCVCIVAWSALSAALCVTTTSSRLSDVSSSLTGFLATYCLKCSMRDSSHIYK